MIQLFIIISLLVIGKICGHDVIIPHINVQFWSRPVPLNERTQLVLKLRQNWKIVSIPTGPLLQGAENPTLQAAYNNHLTSLASGLNHPSSVSEIQKPDRMNQPTEDTKTSVQNKCPNANDKDSSNFEENHPKLMPSEVTSVNQNTSSTSKLKAANETLTLPPTSSVTVINPATNETVLQPVDKNGTKVTFDERANFEGKCPTGYIRVNGNCTPVDED